MFGLGTFCLFAFVTAGVAWEGNLRKVSRLAFDAEEPILPALSSCQCKAEAIATLRTDSSKCNNGRECYVDHYVIGAGRTALQVPSTFNTCVIGQACLLYP